MNTNEIQSQVLTITDQLKKIHANTPELSGWEQAMERGNVPYEEFQAVAQQAKEGSAKQESELLKIVEIKNKHPKEFDVFMNSLLSQLKANIQQLEEKRTSVSVDVFSPVDFNATCFLQYSPHYQIGMQARKHKVGCLGPGVWSIPYLMKIISGFRGIKPDFTSLTSPSHNSPPAFSAKNYVSPRHPPCSMNY